MAEPPPSVVARVFRRQVLVMAAGNFALGCVLIALDPGRSPALSFLRLIGLPLPVWGAAYAMVAVLLTVGSYVIGHTVAALLWVFLAVGALLGLVTGATTSPAASATLAVLTAVVASLHVIGLHWRRAERHRGEKQ